MVNVKRGIVSYNDAIVFLLRISASLSNEYSKDTNIGVNV